MSFSFSRVGRQTLVYAGGVFLNRAVSFVMLPIYTNVLTTADYGVLALVLLSIDIIAIFAGPSLTAGVFRFHAKARSSVDKDALLWTALVMLGVSFTTMAVVGIAAAGRLSSALFGSRDHTILLQLASAALFGQGLQLVPATLIRLKANARLFVFIEFGKLLMQLTLNIIFLIPLAMGVKGVLLSSLLANIFFGFLLLGYAMRIVKPRFSPIAARQLLFFGLPLIPKNLAAFVLTYGDRYFLNVVGTVAVVGLYSLAYQLASILFHIVYWPFSMAWDPIRFEIAKRPDRDIFFARAFLYLNIVLLTVAVGIAVLVNPVLRIMAHKDFHDAGFFVPIILVAYVLQVWTNFFDTGILVRERTSLLTVADWVAALCSLVAYMLLIPRFFALGAALATVLAYSVRFALVYSISQRIWHVRFDWGPVLLAIGTATLSVGVGLVLESTNLALELLMRFGLLLVYASLLWWLPILNQSDRVQIREMLRTLLHTVSRFRESVPSSAKNGVRS